MPTLSSPNYDGPDRDSLSDTQREHDVSGSDADDGMTRSEEELRVGTTSRESGRARLRKYVVTEQVEKTVPVKREEVRYHATTPIVIDASGIGRHAVELEPAVY